MKNGCVIFRMPISGDNNTRTSLFLDASTAAHRSPKVVLRHDFPAAALVVSGDSSQRLACRSSEHSRGRGFFVLLFCPLKAAKI